MKKIISMVLILIIAFSLCGCMRESVVTTFNEDGTGEVFISVYIDKETLESIGANLDNFDSTIPITEKIIDNKTYVGQEETIKFRNAESLDIIFNDNSEESSKYLTEDSQLKFNSYNYIEDGYNMIKIVITSNKNIVSMPDTNNEAVETINETVKDMSEAYVTYKFPNGIESCTEDSTIENNGNEVKIDIFNIENGEIEIVGKLNEVGEFNNFGASKLEYNNNFNDVEEDIWYASAVEKAYSYGIIKGVSNSEFKPMNNITIAEALVMADRVYSMYTKDNQEFKAKDGEQWYNPYVEYAKSNGIINKDFDNYNNPIRRDEMAYIFGNILPIDGYKVVKEDASAPDVDQSNEYYKSIDKLYKASILIGSDSNGTFYPDTNITRSQAATIITRVVEIENR